MELQNKINIFVQHSIRKIDQIQFNLILKQKLFVWNFVRLKTQFQWSMNQIRLINLAFRISLFRLTPRHGKSKLCKQVPFLKRVKDINTVDKIWKVKQISAQRSITLVTKWIQVCTRQIVIENIWQFRRSTEEVHPDKNLLLHKQLGLRMITKTIGRGRRYIVKP